MRILVLVPELHGDFVIGEREKLLSQPVALFLLPLLGEEAFDRCSANDEAGSIAPYAVWCIGLRNDLGISTLGEGWTMSGGVHNTLIVPEVLCLLDFGKCGRFGKGRCERHLELCKYAVWWGRSLCEMRCCSTAQVLSIHRLHPHVTSHIYKQYSFSCRKLCPHRSHFVSIIEV